MDRLRGQIAVDKLDGTCDLFHEEFHDKWYHSLCSCAMGYQTAFRERTRIGLYVTTKMAKMGAPDSPRASKGNKSKDKGGKSGKEDKDNGRCAPTVEELDE